MSDLSAPERLDPAAAAPTLDHLALLDVAGADARTFLDSQLTRNVPADDARAAPAGYCSPKGRLLATLVVWTDDGTVRLLVARDIAEAIAKRLRMYVLRARVTIADPAAGVVLGGVVAPSADAGVEPWAVRRDGGVTTIRWPDGDGRPRSLRVGPPSTAGGDGTPLDATSWRWLDIRAGLATVRTATQDRFVPQMLNLEALGGVDFKKGCYPGQEVVARSQYLGKLKRRMALAALPATAPVPDAGADVFAAGQADPVGLIVDAERGPGGSVAVLAELPVALFGSDALRAVAADGPALTVEALPYALPDNEVFVRPKL